MGARLFERGPKSITTFFVLMVFKREWGFGRSDKKCTKVRHVRPDFGGCGDVVVNVRRECA